MKRFTEVQPGQEMAISAADWNRLNRAADQWLDDDSGTAGESNRILLPAGQVNIFNNGDLPVPAFGVLRVAGSLYPYPGETFSFNEQLRNAYYPGIEVFGGAPRDEENEILCVVLKEQASGKIGRGVVFGPVCVRVDVKDTGHRFAKPVDGCVDTLVSAGAGPVRLMVPALETGPQICYAFLGLPAGDPAVNAKELFPAVVYRRYREEKQDDGSIIEVPETFVICPGGKGSDRSIKTVHVLHVEEKTMSTSTFGSLPMAMNNFGAALADNGYGEPMLVCAPGEVDEGSRYPVQRYEFSQELWSKSDDNQSLAGCPVYVVDGNVIVAGGQSGYFVSTASKNAVSGTWGFNITPFWSNDPVAGTLQTRIPSRKTSESTIEITESNIANQQKRFLKQNFSGIPLAAGVTAPDVEFLAVGGTELLGYQANAVVSYAMNSTGPILDCENATIRIGGDCEIFPDTPVPLGECKAVRIKRRKSGNMTADCDLLVCIGGRYRDENGKFVFHEKPWYLDLDNKNAGWKNDLFPELPTPRYNAALSDVVTTDDEIIDEDTGEPTGETRKTDRVFLIGGRTEKGLTASIEALNLTTGEWEKDWPGLDGRIPKQQNEVNDD